MNRKAVVIGVGVFALVDILLIVLAIRHVSATDPVSSGNPTSTSSESSANEVTATDSAGSSGASSAPASSASATSGLSMISLASDGSAIAATSGKCSTGAAGAVQVSTDSGQSFQPVSQQFTEILRVIATSKQSLSVVATDKDCKMVLYQSVDGGKTWSEGPADANWGLGMDAPATAIFTPNGPADVGCPVSSLSVLSDSMAVVGCDDGKIRMTSNTGASWDDAGNVQGVTAVSFINQSTGFALAVGQSCPAEVQTTKDGGKSWAPVGCINGQNGQSIDVVGSTALASVDGTIHKSTDGGVTWS